jgi:hypothetical protein
MKLQFHETDLKQLALDNAHLLNALDNAPEYDAKFHPNFNMPMLNRALVRYSQDGNTEAFLGPEITLNAVSGRAVLVSFFERFFVNIREVVCGKEGQAAAKAANLSAKGIATALAVWITSAVGVSSATAIALATMTILVIGSAAKKSFCETTEKEFLDTLRKPVLPRRSVKRKPRASKS